MEKIAVAAWVDISVALRENIMKRLVILSIVVFVAFGTFRAAPAAPENGEINTIIKITSLNPNEEVSVGLAYRAKGVDNFYQKETPFEEKFAAEFIGGSFINLSGNGKIKVEITENSVIDSKHQKFRVRGEGEFISIESESFGWGKRFRVSSSDAKGSATKLKKLFTKFDVVINEKLELLLNDETRRTGFIREIKKNGLVFRHEKTGFFSVIPYSEIKDVEKSNNYSGNARLSQNPSLKTYWENFFARKLNNTVAGYSYAVFQDGKPITVGSYGYDLMPELPDNPGIPLSPKTRMHIASVSKPITAVALLHALESKNISTETKIWPLLKPLFPDFKSPAKGVEEITIEQILSHKSGYNFDYVEPPRIENLKKLFSKPVPNKTGDKYIYSNINYAIAATLVEQVSGKSYKEYVREYIFAPVGVRDIRLHTEKQNASYIYRIGDPAGVQFVDDFSGRAGAFGWYSTPAEIVKFLGMTRKNKYLSPEMTKKMFSQRLGWLPVRTPAGTAFRHEGQWSVPGNYGIHTGVAILPDGVDAVLFINTKARYSASNLLVEAFNDNIPFMRGYPDPKDPASLGIVRVETPIHVEDVRCTSDGSKPNTSSTVYLEPIAGKMPLTVNCQGFIGKSPVTFVNTVTVDAAKTK